MKASEALRRAAELVESRGYSESPAIDAACPREGPSYGNVNATMHDCFGLQSFGSWHDQLIVGLCLAAAVAESEGD